MWVGIGREAAAIISAAKRAARALTYRRQGGIAWLLLVGVYIIGLSACQSRSPMPVRVEVERAMQALSLPDTPAPLDQRLPAMSVAQSPEAITLESVEPPPPAEMVSRRRQASLKSIEQQREAVRQRLLNARLQALPELEQRWRAELYAEYDLAALQAERDAEWQEAFQQYGRQRFPLLVALVFAAPDSEARRQAQARLEQLDRAWQAQQQAIESAYRARRERIEQEVAVRVNARRREFIRNAELETLRQMEQQPDPAELYLPQPQPLPPAPARKQPVPTLTLRLPERALSAPYSARRAQSESLRRQILTQLAEEWAAIHNYRLTRDPRAPDKTDEFIRYLLAK